MFRQELSGHEDFIHETEKEQIDYQFQEEDSDKFEDPLPQLKRRARHKRDKQATKAKAVQKPVIQTRIRKKAAYILKDQQTR
ncbi:MAG: hypothetical protein EZS28_050976, partial [Streblomastix strix]